MKNRVVCVCMMLTIVLSWAVAPVFADRTRRQDNTKGEKYYRNQGYKKDKRHRHNRYYPSRGRAVKVLPRGYRVFPYQNLNYYFHGGVWYRPSGLHFRIVIPPFGLVVPILPSYYTTIWVGGLPYYYAGGVYYVWRPERRAYVVTHPPPESNVVEQQELPEQLFIYPKNGQSPDLQATDRYECHRWAVEQTDFDPTRSGGNVTQEQNTAKRSDYQRAMKACLGARGYSVK